MLWLLFALLFGKLGLIIRFVFFSNNMEKIELKVHKPKPTRMTSIDESIQLVRIQQAATTSALYERKHNQKALKVITVAAYILFVSMAAITLSFYYVFIWDPSSKAIPPRSGITTNCGLNKFNLFSFVYHCILK